MTRASSAMAAVVPVARSTIESPARGRAIRLAGKREIAGFRLHHIVIPGPCLARAGPPICRQMNTYEFWIGLGERGVIDAELRWQVASQIVEDGVAGAHQVEQDLPALRLFEIERNRLLVAVERLVEIAV